MANRGYSDQELNSMAVEQLRELDRELSTSGGNTQTIKDGRIAPTPLPSQKKPKPHNMKLKYFVWVFFTKI